VSGACAFSFAGGFGSGERGDEQPPRLAAMGPCAQVERDAEWDAGSVQTRMRCCRRRLQQRSRHARSQLRVSEVSSITSAACDRVFM
jgi:hypothetical protein